MLGSFLRNNLVMLFNDILFSLIIPNSRVANCCEPYQQAIGSEITNLNGKSFINMSGSNIRFFPPSTAYPRGECFGSEKRASSRYGLQFAKHGFFPTEHGHACRHVLLGPEIYSLIFRFFFFIYFTKKMALTAQLA